MYTTSVKIENSQKLQTALVHFIVNRADGDMLRDIAIRTLKDLNAKYERAYYGTNELKIERFKEVTPKISNASPFVSLPKKKINTNTKRNIRSIRERLNLSQEHFSKMIHLKREDCANYENGRCIVPIEVVVNVCTAFNIPIDKFLTDSI